MTAKEAKVILERNGKEDKESEERAEQLVAEAKKINKETQETI